MNAIFGIPMGAILVALLVVLAVCLLAVAWVAWRQPVVFKLGVRNIPRRKAQTTLIVVGLMLSTLIIAASLTTGDTLEHSVSGKSYDLVGHVDEIVVSSQDIEAEVQNALSVKIDGGALAVVERAVGDDPNVDGVMPALLEMVPVVNEGKGQAEPQVSLVGFDPTRIDRFGGLRDLGGRAIDLGALPPDSVVLSETAAEDLDAAPGDRLTTFYANRSLPLTVAAVAPDSVLSGVIDFTLGGMAMPLDRLQRLTNQPDTLSLIAVSNAGGVRDGLRRSSPTSSS